MKHVEITRPKIIHSGSSLFFNFRIRKSYKIRGTYYPFRNILCILFMNILWIHFFLSFVRLKYTLFTFQNKVPHCCMKKSFKYKNQTLIMRRRIRLSRLIPDPIQSFYWANRSYRLNYLKSFSNRPYFRFKPKVWLTASRGLVSTVTKH